VATGVEQLARSRIALEIVIVRGEPVPAGRLMGVVGLTYATSTPRCTGTLIQQDVVLTAAHCLCGEQPRNVFVGTDWTARSGDKAGTAFEIAGARSAIYWPPNPTRSQCEQGLRDRLDLAILKLRTPVPLEVAAPVPVAGSSLISSAKSYRIAGFGTTDPTGDSRGTPVNKQHAEVFPATNDCRGKRNGMADASYYGCKSGSEIVAIGGSGSGGVAPDTCSGDSGGPLLVTDRGDAGDVSTSGFRLAGVTSRGILRSPQPCGYGGIYERLTPQAINWIGQAVHLTRLK
jgi:secreted trypsin-like serine protease